MIKLDNVSKTFGTGASALQDVTVSIDKGEFVFLVGPSGSGKTTFFRLLIRDMTPTAGTIMIDDLDITTLPSGKVPHLRKNIGVVFQDLKLLMDRTIFENIILPLEMSGESHGVALEKGEAILAQVGILEHRDKFPIQLSGGEMQRAAIARALIFSPQILLADEPTGNLDTVTSWEIVKLLQDINNLGTTVIMATHNNDIINSLLKRVVTLEKGRLVKDDLPAGRQVRETESNSAKAKETKEAEKDKAEEKKEHKEHKEEKEEEKK